MTGSAEWPDSAETGDITTTQIQKISGSSLLARYTFFLIKRPDTGFILQFLTNQNRALIMVVGLKHVNFRGIMLPGKDFFGLGSVTIFSNWL